MRARLRLTRQQILAFRRRVGSLHERLPPGAASLERAAWAGLQDSMPRAALLSLHARVTGVGPSTLDDAALAQLWGPRYNTYVVARRDFALFSLGRLPDSEKGRLRASRIAAAVHAHLDGRRMTDREAGSALGLGPSIRYAATTGTVEIRWGGARAPVIWSVPPPDIEPADACRELARRHLHVFGPTTAAGFARWAGVVGSLGGGRVRRARGIPRARPIAARRRVAARGRRARDARHHDRAGARAAAAERRCVLPPPRRRAGAPRAPRGAARAALDLSGLARRPPRRRRDPRDLAAREAHGAHRRVGDACRAVRARQSRPRRARFRSRAWNGRPR